MHRLAVREQNDAEVSCFLLNVHPTPNPAICLHGLRDRMFDSETDPYDANSCTIRSTAGVAEIIGELHGMFF